MDIRKIEIIVLGTGCSSSKNSVVNSNQSTTMADEVTKAEPLSVSDVEVDGQQYRIETYQGIQAMYPVNNRSIVSREKIYSDYGKNSNVWSRVQENESFYPASVSVVLPSLFEDENISTITYTLQNCVGTFNKSGTFDVMDYYKNGKMIKSDSVTWTREEACAKPGVGEYFSVGFTICMEFNGKTQAEGTLEVSLFKEAIDNALIKADITYIDGTQETQYIQIVTTSPYNYKTVDFYRLTME